MRHASGGTQTLAKVFHRNYTASSVFVPTHKLVPSHDIYAQTWDSGIYSYAQTQQTTTYSYAQTQWTIKYSFAQTQQTMRYSFAQT